MMLCSKSGEILQYSPISKYVCWMHPKQPQHTLMQFVKLVEENFVKRLSSVVILVESSTSRQLIKIPSYKKSFTAWSYSIDIFWSIWVYSIWKILIYLRYVIDYMNKFSLKIVHKPRTYLKFSLKLCLSVLSRIWSHVKLFTDKQ